MDGIDGLPWQPPPCKTSPWTDERIAHLTTRWSQGASAGQISRELGNGISRCSVIGKIHRLGIVDLSPHGGVRRRWPATKESELPAAKEDRPAPERRSENPPAAKHSRKQHSPPSWVANAKPYIDDPLVDAGIPFSRRRSFLQLNCRTCRWPVGDPASADFFFCGAKPLQDKPYCAAHCARAYRPAKKKPQHCERPAYVSRHRGTHGTWRRKHRQIAVGGMRR
jgi:GcrA cell cycle regulator